MRYKMVRVIDHEATGSQWRTIRESLNVSLRDLAQTMGVSAPYLRALERGRCNWTEELQSKYAGALQVDAAIVRECTCHERDSSYACPKCYAEGHRGHMDPQLVEFKSCVREYRIGYPSRLVLEVESDRDRETFDDLLPHVMVDDEVYKVCCFEATLPLRKGDKFAIIVEVQN